MALTQIELPELQAILTAVTAQASNERHLTGQLFNVMLNTGLRVEEVLAVDRWQAEADDTYTVQLAKREGTRSISRDDIPPSLYPYYSGHQPFELQTYSSVNNTFKYYAPALYFEDFKRTTTCHAFRYAFIKQLRANGMSINDIAAYMGHLGTTATARYISAHIWRGPVD